MDSMEQKEAILTSVGTSHKHSPWLRRRHLDGATRKRSRRGSSFSPCLGGQRVTPAKAVFDLAMAQPPRTPKAHIRQAWTFLPCESRTVSSLHLWDNCLANLYPQTAGLVTEQDLLLSISGSGQQRLGFVISPLPSRQFLLALVCS